MDKIYVAALQMVPGIGNRRLMKLIAFFGDARQAWQAGRSDLVACLDEATCHNLIGIRQKLDILALAEKWQEQGIRLSLLTDPDYPALLKPTFNPPLLLYYRGELPADNNSMAIVGGRRASAYGLNAAQMLGSELAAAGVCVVSGAARGVDTAAHRGALTKGRTIAVLGCGVDVSYPPENRDLLDRIAGQGAVISEYPPGTSPHPSFFPARNRIISGLSRGIVVIEAAERSGALITVEHALDEGRDVFAVPGSIFSAISKGCHNLIKQGAKLIDCTGDIFEEYQWSNSGTGAKAGELDLQPDEFAVYEQLSFDKPISLDEIVAATDLTVSAIAYIVLQLELRGLVAEHGSQYYVRTKGGI
ncbi:DNA-protecting protein DprA|uniref:DNA processing protein n=1 Tax=Dendrosporobacter quercicolus TaxID=146817 RepID=A0A1G9ML93_9FIRM|nr:DNA-processing protein DprA [Dendrosporobacter quercicolus]NSL47074.1 DNA-protecting protein DprA [Dendrosporobacter quercicolus DSM 1736]SDL75056.1 DNA processing protein [Dendrosporobacter quercicolus]